MKVLLLNGSANKNGNTFTALSEIARQLEKSGVESEIMQLGNKPVRGCIACGQCQAKQLGHCVFDDDICNRIVEKLNEADALIVGSACGSGSYLPSWWCYGCIPDDEHDIRDDEHACGYFAILEHRLRLGTR